MTPAEGCTGLTFWRDMPMSAGHRCKAKPRPFCGALGEDDRGGSALSLLGGRTLIITSGMVFGSALGWCPAIYTKLMRQWRLRPIEQTLRDAMYWCLPPRATLLPSYYLGSFALPSND